MENLKGDLTPEDLTALRREKARLRKFGLAILLAGLVSAGLLYWIRSRPENPSLAEYREAQSRAESRQMQMLYGQSGGIAEDFLNALKRPGTQAVIIVIIAGLLGGGCYYLGRPLEENDAAE